MRDAENLSADLLQRILGSQLWNLPVVAGVGTGYSAGIVGKTPTNITGHLAITANGTTMVLTALAGWASILRDAGGSTMDPRALFAETDASLTATVTANLTGATRNDTVCLQIDQASAPTSDGGNLVNLVIIAGAAGGGLSNAPVDGNLYLPLANVAVANGAANIAQGSVTDLRQVIPAAPNVPGGTLPGGYAESIANQTPITTVVDLTSLTVNVTVGAGRRIKITGYIGNFTSSVATDKFTVSIQEAATVLASATSTVQASAAGGAAATPFQPMRVLQPTPGSHTYKLTCVRNNGTGNGSTNSSATDPSFILVEDAGV